MTSNIAPERTVNIYGLEIVLQCSCIGEQPVKATVLDYEEFGKACEMQGYVDSILEDLEI